MKIPSTLAVYGLIAALAPALAVAGSITTASGPIKVNGQDVRVEAGNPLVLNEGDELDTQGATVTWTSAAGDEVTLEPGTIARADGVAQEADHLFVMSGAAYGAVSDKTIVGVSAGWMTAATGEKAEIFLEAPSDVADIEGTFRARTTGAWVRYHAYRVWVPAQHSVALTIDPTNPDILFYRTAQTNTGAVQVTKVVGGGEIIAFVPKASIGSMEPWEGGKKTKVSNDITSLKTTKTPLETRFPGKPPQKAELGAGTYALIDNATGDIEVVFEVVEFVILDRAISLTAEFATLAQSNFSDINYLFAE